MAVAKPVQLRSLTSLRFVAASVVLLHHLPLAMPGLLGALYFAQAGYVGVTFFFVLSGFVLAYGWSSSSVSDFYLRRLARIYPLHVLTASVMVLMLLRTGVDWSVVPLNLVLVQAWSPNAAVHLSLVGASWSLSCEAFFYACFPLLFAFLRRCVHPVRWALLTVGGTLGTGLLTARVWPAAGEYLYHLPIFRLSDFAVGILVALAVRRGWRVSIRPTAAGSLVVTTYLIVLVAQTTGRTGVERMWLYSVFMVVPFALLVASVASRDLDGANSILSSRAPVALGHWSFALYLVHGVILAALYGQIHELRGAAALVVGAAVIALIVTTSWLVYALYEHPVNAMIRRRLASRAASSPVDGATAGPVDTLGAIPPLASPL